MADAATKKEGAKKEGANNEDSAEGAAAAAPKSKKTLIIVAIAVLVLAGGGFAAFKMLGGKPDEKDAKAKVKDEKHEILPPRYITLDPPFVVNFQADDAVRFLQITIGVMTRDLELEKIVKENDPRVRNDLLLILGNQSYATVSTLEGKEELRKRSLEAVRTVVKESGGEPEKIEALYFTSFVMQ